MFRNLADNPWLLLILVLIVVLVFGANKLPGAARSLGRSMRIFKSEMKEMKTDGKDADAAPAPRTVRDDEAEPLDARVLREEHTPRTSEPGADGIRRDA